MAGFLQNGYRGGGGSCDSIDVFPRLHRFSGNHECLMGMTDSVICPPMGFLTADDTRNSYYLSEESNRLVYCEKKIIYDKTLGLYFKSTDLRLDWFARGFTNLYIYNKPQKRIPYKELVLNEDKGMFKDYQIYEIFTHEWQLYRKGCITRKIRWLEDVCRFAKRYGWEFSFLQETAAIKDMVVRDVN